MWALFCQTQTWHSISWAREERLQFNQKVCGLSAEGLWSECTPTFSCGLKKMPLGNG